MSNDFNFSGLPSNDAFEVPSKKQKNKINKPPMNNDGLEFLNGLSQGNLDFSTVKKILPKQILDQLEAEANAAGITDLESFFNENISVALQQMGLDDLEDDTEEEIEEERYVYELSDIKYLGHQLLGSVPAYTVGADRLLGSIKKIFNEDFSNFPNIIESVLSQYAYVDETGYNALMYIKNNFGKISVKESSENFVLLFAQTKNSDEYGIYFVYSEGDNGEPLISVPLFANTFKVNEDGEFEGLYNKTVETPFFDGDRFIPEKRAALDLSIRSQLVTLKNILLSPAQFGTLKNIIPAITGDSRYLKVGTLVSNESTEAILLKKDADLDLNQTDFPFYFDFGREISRESLQILSSILFKIDLNDTLLMKATELEFKNKMLYIRVNFGEYFN